MNKQVSSRELAKSWPFEAHLDFEKMLRSAAAQWFEHKRHKTNKCGYILAEYNDWCKNIVCQDVVNYVKLESEKRANNRQGFPLHKYIHHGLSSQAMLFNLVGPLIMREPQELEPIRSAFQKHGIIKWPSGKLVAKFEDEDRYIFNEMTQQPTSIDLVIENEDNIGGLYIEFKFTEHEFGGCSVFKNGDCDGRNPAKNRSSCYLNHIGRKYWDLLEKYGFLNGPMGENATCFLATYYQFFRDVLYALEKSGEFVLLVDKRNPAFCSRINGQRGLFPFLKGFVPAELKDRVHMVTVQEVVEAIRDLGKYSWIIDFQQKYGIE